LLADAVPSAGAGALVALALFIVGSIWLGTLAQRAVEKGEFLKTYFLGNRGLGAWTIALTATVQSGGTFMGFPSYVYSHGWIVALWIAGYMVVPITGFGVLGKRIAQLSRKTGAVTIPDLYRARFESPVVGTVCSLVIILCMTVMIIAQFKAGAVIMQLAWPQSGLLSISEEEAVSADVGDSGNGTKAATTAAKTAQQQKYWLGLAIFSLTVVGYTMIGGFLAAVWTDLFQSLMMFLGVMLLLFLVVPMAGGLEHASRTAAAKIEASAGDLATTAPFRDRPDAYLSGPGYDAQRKGRDFLPLTKALSFFIFWPFVGMATPAGVVRIMACKDTPTLRKSIVILCLYNMGIYLPLIVICICARAILPTLTVSDEVIPRIAILATADLPLGSFWAGLVLAAPFGAVMATVSAYLVVIASGLVRDIYQRFWRPDANEYELRRASHLAMVLVGLIAVVAVIHPPQFLQKIVVFSSGAIGAAFLVPTFMLCYWRSATAIGVIGAMIGGAGTVFALNLAGIGQEWAAGRSWTGFQEYDLFNLGFDPLLWGLLVSFVCGVIGSARSQPPSAATLAAMFDEG
jgi:SSS family solute:Na+ symporter/sodium/pantothenate symporter